jgi:hypothetical protein
MRNTLIALLLFTVGCGGPMLGSMPRPNPAYIATGVAAVATMMTLADPDGAARNVEEAERANARDDDRPMLVPEEAFDHLGR